MNAQDETGLGDKVCRGHKPRAGSRYNDPGGRDRRVGAQMLDQAEGTRLAGYRVVAVQRAIDKNAQTKQHDGANGRRQGAQLQPDRPRLSAAGGRMLRHANHLQLKRTTRSE